MLPGFKQLIGLASNRTSHHEKIISGLGGFLGILLILILTMQFVAGAEAALIVASMGASAVLLFAVPHGTLSQPWPLVAGHLVSALIGVSCYRLIPDLMLAAAIAVGVSITVMYYLRCVHPPGGATALSAVIAGPAVHELGYQFLITPVLLNVLIILATAFLFNYAFHWRRYPVALMQYTRKPDEQEQSTGEALASEDLEHALAQMDQYVDVGREELGRIYQLARRHNRNELAADQIKLGHYYSNGRYGSDWSVRQVVDESGDPHPERDKIIYKIVAGKGRRSSGTASRREFAEWARYEVYLNENSWQRVTELSKQARAAES